MNFIVKVNFSVLAQLDLQNGVDFMGLPIKRLVERDKLNTFDQMLMSLICTYKDQNIKAQLISLAERCEDLNIKDELTLIALKYQDSHLSGELQELKRYFSQYIHNTESDTITSFKQFVYLAMKNTEPGSDTNKYYYELYQSIKSGEFTLDDIMEFFGKI